MSTFVKQLYTNCLAEAAYYIESNGEAAIIDPIRDIDEYIELANSRNAKIKYIFETHFHADFVSGHIDLAKQTGATIVYGPGAKPNYDVHVGADGENFKLGDVSIKLLHTPGHTLESSCFLLQDENGNPKACFTGDTLFVGGVGRPDLAVKGDNPITPEELAGLLYHSLRDKIMTLPDDVTVYPGHGAGSSCGKTIGKETVSTIGEQKATNYALRDQTKEEFIKEAVEGLGVPPAYFFEDARINIMGYESLDSVMTENMTALSADEVENAISKGMMVLDTRNPEDFETAHVPGSVNIGLNGSFAIWVGTVININEKLIVVTYPGKEEESILRLARVGYENVAGYLEGGIKGWTDAGKETSSIHSIDINEFKELHKKNESVVVDVRRESEYAIGQVKGSQYKTLGEINAWIDSLDKEKEIVVYCRSGYRSMIAASMLQRAGYKNIVNVSGGYLAISEGAPEILAAIEMV